MRKIVSLTLVFSGLVELITSVVLYILPAGRVAYWTDYRLFGLSKTDWGNIHITVGTLFLIMAILHIYLNWRPILTYIKKKASVSLPANRQTILSILFTAYVTVGTLYNLPPMKYVVSLGEYFSDQANIRYGEPPYGHAELSSLKMFARKMYLDLDKAQALLHQANIAMTGPEQTLLEIAQNNHQTPQAIYELIKPAAIQSPEKSQAFPDSPAPGFGTKTIREICSAFGFPEDRLLAYLQDAGVTFSPEDSIKDGATRNNRSPIAVFELIHAFAGKFQDKQN